MALGQRILGFLVLELLVPSDPRDLMFLDQFSMEVARSTSYQYEEVHGALTYIALCGVPAKTAREWIGLVGPSGAMRLALLTTKEVRQTDPAP